MKKQGLFFGFLFLVVAAVAAIISQLPQQKAAAIENQESSISEKDDPEGRIRHELMMLRDPATGRIPADIKRREL